MGDRPRATGARYPERGEACEYWLCESHQVVTSPWCMHRIGRRPGVWALAPVSGMAMAESGTPQAATLDNPVPGGYAAWQCVCWSQVVAGSSDHILWKPCYSEV